MLDKYSYIASLVLFFFNKISGDYLISKCNMDKICDMFLKDKDLSFNINNIVNVNYVCSNDENNNKYLVLKNDYDYKMWENIFFSMPLEFYRIIMSDYVLNVLNIKFIDNKLKKYTKSI